ncbi:unnamed protein product, partial [Ectocarpus fasciculatus]
GGEDSAPRVGGEARQQRLLDCQLHLQERWATRLFPRSGARAGRDYPRTFDLLLRLLQEQGFLDEQCSPRRPASRPHGSSLRGYGGRVAEYDHKPDLDGQDPNAAALGGHCHWPGGVRGLQGGDWGYLQGRGGEGFLQGHVGVLLGVQRGVPLLCTLRAN